MANGFRLIASLLFVTASFGLHATPQIAETTGTLTPAAALSATPDFTIWMLIAVGTIAVVVARKRI